MVGMAFEREVRGVARALWQLPAGKGAAELIGNDEIDCVCETEDVVHIIECTIERRLEKFREQANKLVAAKRVLEGRGDTVKMWIVTKEVMIWNKGIQIM